MGSNEQEHGDAVSSQDVSEAFGDLYTSHHEGPLTRSQMEQALRAAATDIYRCTVAVMTMFEEDEVASASFEDLWPGTGVLVECCGVHGIITAGHVLGVEKKRKRYEACTCTIGVMPLRDTRTRAEQQLYFPITRRLCRAYGVRNHDSTGPDIAYIPLTPGEWARLDADGARAWTPFEEPAPDFPQNTKDRILLDCCVGSNHMATRTVREAHPGLRPAMAFQALQVLELAKERIDVGDWDYTKFTLKGDVRGTPPPTPPRQTREQTYRDFLDYQWHKLDPKDMLGGFSGTGLWTAAIRVTETGAMSLHAKRLKGILFYAGPGPDATLHGKQSIRRIIDEGLNRHGQAAVDEAEL